MLILFLLCCLLGLSCYSYVQYEHTEKHDNTICEIKSKDNFGYYEERDLFYLSLNDFSNGDFIRIFLNNIPVYYGIGLGSIDTGNAYLDLGGSFHPITNGVVMNDTTLASPYSLRINKYRSDFRQYEDNVYYEMYYTFDFLTLENNSNVSVLQISYIFEVPFYDYYADDLGISCIYSNLTINTFNSVFIAYLENPSTGATPFLDYGYKYYARLSGNIDSFNNGYNQGLIEGRRSGYDTGYEEGLQVGFTQGVNYSAEASSTALTIFTGIVNVGLLPVNVFLQFFNYEVFGINIAGFVSSLITIAIVVIIIRFVTGKKND